MSGTRGEPPAELDIKGEHDVVPTPSSCRALPLPPGWNPGGNVQTNADVHQQAGDRIPVRHICLFDEVVPYIPSYAMGSDSGCHIPRRDSESHHREGCEY